MFHFSKSVWKLSAMLIFILPYITVRAQSNMIKNVFKLLPPRLVYGISQATKDSLLKGKTYYPAENDSKAIVAINYGESIFVKDYMYISMSYETSQRASGMVELRSFEINGKNLVIVSNCGGVEGINYQQNDISTFLYDGRSQLIPYKEKVFTDMSENLFLKPGIPDSIKRVILNNANLTFDFSKANVLLSLNSSFLLNDPACRKWMIGDQIGYTWTGVNFKAGQVYFSDEND